MQNHEIIDKNTTKLEKTEKWLSTHRFIVVRLSNPVTQYSRHYVTFLRS